MDNQANESQAGESNKKFNYDYKVDAAAGQVEINLSVDLDQNGKPGMINKTVLSVELVKEIYAEFMGHKA